MNKIEQHTINNDLEAIKEWNSNISILLILINVFLLLIYKSTVLNSGNNEIENSLWLIGSCTILLGGYAFNYNGKNYRTAKWIFAIVFVICTVYFGLLWYSAQLAKAFNH